MTAVLFAVCAAPTFISYQPYQFQWDDSDYLQRSIAVSRAFWTGNVHGLGAAMVSIRPPAMTLLGIPWGPLASWDAASKCFITLAAVISLVAALCLYLLLRIGVKPFLVVAASACVVASIGPYPRGGTTHEIATGFMADSLFAWTSLAAVLLVPYEARTASHPIGSSVARGILWASVLSLGVLTKLSFLYFVVLIVPALFVIRLRRFGVHRALAALIAFACLSAPSAVYLVRWGRSAFDNAKASSFGPLAIFGSKSLLQYLGSCVRESPGLVLSFVLTAITLIYWGIKKRRDLLGPDLLSLLIIVGFAIVVLASPNREIRYEFPVIVALPFLTGIVISAKGCLISGPSAALAATFVFFSLFAAGLPTRHRADRRSLSRCDAVLADAAGRHAKRILLATDSPTLNDPLMDLAVEVSPWATSVNTDTLAYQALTGVPIREDFLKMSEFDEVVFQNKDALSPPYTNQRVPEYEQYVRQAGYAPMRVGDDLTVYSMWRRP